MFASLFCGPIFAAPIHLGPEIALSSQIRPGPAAYAQYTPVIASNGRDFLAAWADEREQTTVRQSYGTRIDAEGRPLDPFGRKLAASSHYTPMLASNGDGYLLLWSKFGSAPFLLQPLDENGSLAGAGRSLDASLFPLELLSNGRTYLLVATTIANEELIAVSLDGDGVILDRKPLRLSARRSDGYWSYAAGISGGRYDFVGYEPSCFSCAKNVMRSVDEHNGSLTITDTNFSFEPPLDFNRRQYYARPVVTPDRIFYSWANVRSSAGSEWRTDTQFIIVDRAAKIVAPLTTLDGSSPFHSVFWDGSEFLLLWSPQVQLRGVRIRADGAPLWPVQVTSSARGLPFVASNGAGILLGWCDLKFDLRSRFVRAFSDLAVAPAEDTLLAYSGRPQTDVKIAAIGNRVMGVWSDDEHHEIIAAVDGREFSVVRQRDRVVGPPSITAGGDAFLVSWFEREDLNNGALLFARRYSLHGAPLEEAPLSLGPALSVLEAAPGVAADGDAFVVATETSELVGSYAIELRRIEGDVVSTLWTHACQEWCYGGSLAPLKTDSEWIVPYVRYVGFFSPHIEVTWGIALLSMPLSGTGARKSAAVFSANAMAISSVGATRAGGQIALTMRSSKSLDLMQQFSASGTLVRSAIPQAAGAVASDIAWNGSEYVVAWSTVEGGPIRAMRLDVNGRPLDSEPFDLAPEGSTTAPPSVVATDRGVVIGYSRSDRANGGAPRAFMRTLDALAPLVTRRPAARH